MGVVPNTTDFTLQDVVDAVNPTTGDLVDCFSDAVDGYFDSRYKGSKDNMLDFQNYGAYTVAISSVTVTTDYGTYSPTSPPSTPIQTADASPNWSITVTSLISQDENINATDLKLIISPMLDTGTGTLTYKLTDLGGVGDTVTTGGTTLTINILKTWSDTEQEFSSCYGPRTIYFSITQKDITIWNGYLKVETDSC